MDEQHRCIDCEHCDAINAICILNHKEYDLKDADMWLYSQCEFFQEKIEQLNNNYNK